MITVTVYKDSGGRYRGFQVSGHAGYARRGKDIVCAAVSALITGTVNAIETLTDDEIIVVTDEKKPLLALKFRKSPCRRAALLMDALVLSLRGIEREYCHRGYLHLKMKEV